MRISGSQYCMPLKGTPEYTFIQYNGSGEIILHNAVGDKFEIWQVNNNFVGYSLKVGAWRYEFCSTVQNPNHINWYRKKLNCSV
jgi:hypothetical protein